MHGWARRAPALIVIALALRLVQCASETGSDESSIGVPGRVEREAGGEAGLSDVQTIVPDGGRACDPTKPFGAPTRLTEIDPAIQAATPRLSRDELTLYFTTQQDTTGTDLARAVRSTSTGPFGKPTIMPESTASNDNDPSVSFDHLRLFFQSTRNGSSDIFTASRTSTSAPFGPVSAVNAVNTDAGESHAYFRQATNELWFVRDEGPTGYDIFVARENGAAFDPPKKVTELSSPANDWQPQVSEDGLTVVFASDRDGGSGGFDLWTARRASATAPFAQPVALAELNTGAAEFAGWLSADGCRIWFSSNRLDASGVSSIYFAERPR